jgi:Fur family ferric uptake transcriptional regulator
VRKPLPEHGDLDTALDALRGQGQRVTTARRAVVQTLLAADHDLSAGEVAASIESTQPDTHLSTVYRTLEALEEAGIVVHVHASHGGVAYQLADRRSQHAECDMCGLVFELPSDILDGVADQLRSVHDFELDTRHFPLLGRCARCREQEGAGPHRHGR